MYCTKMNKAVCIPHAHLAGGVHGRQQAALRVVAEKAQVGDGGGVVLEQRAGAGVAVEDADLAALEAVADVVGVHGNGVAVAAGDLRLDVGNLGHLEA